MRRLFPLLALFALVGVARADVKPGQRAHDFEEKTLTGSTVKLSSLRGKVVLLDFWASWCEPCKKELPLLNKMAQKLKSQGVEVVAVNIDENKQNAISFIKEHGLNLTVVLDEKHQIVGEYEPPKMPSSFVIDRAGMVRAVNAGFEPGDEAKLEKQLTTLK